MTTALNDFERSATSSWAGNHLHAKKAAIVAVTIFGSLTTPSALAAATVSNGTWTQPISPGAVAVRDQIRLPRTELLETKQLSGLTWGQLASCLGVAPRTLHNWMHDEGITVEHEERLRALGALVRRTASGSPAWVRAVFMDASNGPSLLEKLTLGADPRLVQIDTQDLAQAHPAYVGALEALRSGSLPAVPARRARRPDGPVAEITLDLARAAGGLEQVDRGRKSRPPSVGDGDH